MTLAVGGTLNTNTTSIYSQNIYIPVNLDHLILSFSEIYGGLPYFKISSSGAKTILASAGFERSVYGRDIIL